MVDISSEISGNIAAAIRAGVKFVAEHSYEMGYYDGICRMRKSTEYEPCIQATVKSILEKVECVLLEEWYATWVKKLETDLQIKADSE